MYQGLKNTIINKGMKCVMVNTMEVVRHICTLEINTYMYTLTAFTTLFT